VRCTKRQGSYVSPSSVAIETTGTGKG
jgi:hypothetical protein